MRCRICIKHPFGISKVANFYFTSYEPSFYVDFPYLKVGPVNKFMAGLMIPNAEKSMLVYQREHTYFFESSPKFSYHLSGQAHIKDSFGHVIPDLIVKRSKLMEQKNLPFMQIVIKNPMSFKQLNEKKDAGDEENKNLIIDFGFRLPEAVVLTGFRIYLGPESPWFSDLKQNQPIVGIKKLPSGQEVLGIFYSSTPMYSAARVVFVFEITEAKNFESAENDLLFMRSAYGESFEDPDYTELQIIAPMNPSKVAFVN